MSLSTFGTAVPSRPPGAYPQEITRSLSEMGNINVWAVDGDAFSGCPGAQPSLDPAFYRVTQDNYGRPVLLKMAIAIDELIRLPDPITDMLLAEFVGFWKSVDRFAELGLTKKRGLLLYGPPGSGKTSALALMAQHMIVEKQGIVIMAERPEITVACLHMLRKIEPKRPVIVLYEDLDALVERFGESGYLSLLDGETQISNVVNVATTNYPERLDRRFVDRPGRFDRVARVGMPTTEARLAYLKSKAPDVDDVRRQRWVKASDGWSLAHLRELIVATQALGESDDDAIKRLNGMREDQPSSSHDEGSRRIGL